MLPLRPRPVGIDGLNARGVSGAGLWLGVLAGLLLLYAPAYWELANTLWRSEEQGHGPIIFALACWMLWRERAALLCLPERPCNGAGGLLLVVSLATFLLGRSQDIWIFAIGSQIGVLAALLLLFRGWAGLRWGLFPLFFLLFMVPLPEALVAAVTAPLKSAVSYVASQLLYLAGLPVGRSGVILVVGPFQLMVADACAGLNSMFTLEALGIFYMRLMNYRDWVRNTALAVLLVPIAFIANVGRVIVLVLVTYFWGDAAGQGFVHGFAGLVLFLFALVLMLIVDWLLGWWRK